MPLLLIAFIAGVLTVLAPCILPLLPVIVGGSLDRKPSAHLLEFIISSLGLQVHTFTFG